jgi:small subunit ribosomal protein S11
MAKKTKKMGKKESLKKKKKRKVPKGHAYIKASFNNTIVTLTDTEGNVLATSSPGEV